jgi:transposase
LLCRGKSCALASLVTCLGTLMDKVGEIISRVERRRRWPSEQKVRILTEALRPGATFTAVADRNGISRSQLYAWKRLAREGKIPGVSLTQPKPLFVPVKIANAPASPPALSAPPAAAASPLGWTATVEVALRNGRVVRAYEGIEPGRLLRLIVALEEPRS